MTGTMTPPETRVEAEPLANSLTAGKLPRNAPWMILGASLLVAAALFGVMAIANGSSFDVVATIVVAAILYVAATTVFSRIVEGSRRAMDRFITSIVTGAFLLAMLPLVSVAISRRISIAFCWTWGLKKASSQP